MSKIMCDVCGTVFPKNASCCPICGWSPEGAPADDEELTFENHTEETHDERDLSSVFGHNWEEEGGDAPMGYPQHQELRQQFNSPLVIALVIIIILLLIATSVLFFGFFLPNRNKAAVVTETTIADTYQPETEETILSIPCTGLVLTSGKAELQEAGQLFLIHVKVMPENTTDAIQYISENPEIATVSESGRITAVAEGETSIMIVCGSQMIRTNVSVHFVPEQTAATVAAAPSEEVQAETEAASEPTETAAETQVPEQTDAAETEAVTEAATEAPTEAATEATEETTAPLKEVALQLAKHDVKMECKKGQYTTLKLDCDLSPEEVEWSSSDPAVATVKDGKVFAMSNGTTNVTVRYGDQESTCIVRVKIIK